MKEFDLSFGERIDDKDELRYRIKEKEKAGYIPMQPNEADRFFKTEKQKYKMMEKIKEQKRIEKLLERNGFV